MHVIAHQHVGVETTFEALQRFAQASEIPPAIIIVNETRHPIVAALDDMLRDPEHAENIRRLAKEHYWDGLAILRSQENYVVQVGNTMPGKSRHAEA